MIMLRYADELRKPAEYLDEVPVGKSQKEMIDLAVRLAQGRHVVPRQLRQLVEVLLPCR
jgi:non-homologous end joining protein Ku